MKIYLYEDRKDVYIDAFYPECPDGTVPAVIVCPGGGYHIVGTTEARPVSDKFTDAGYAAFILHYSVGAEALFGQGGFKEFGPVRDLGAAIRLLHRNAAEYGIDPGRIVLNGYSAGGHLCAAYCFSGAGIMPMALILSYPMGGNTSEVGAGEGKPDFDIAHMPYDPAVKKLPTFLWHAKDDLIVPYEASVRLAARLASEGIPHTFLTYEHGVHARPFFDPDWFYKALDWLAIL